MAMCEVCQRVASACRRGLRPLFYSRGTVCIFVCCPSPVGAQSHPLYGSYAWARLSLPLTFSRPFPSSLLTGSKPAVHAGHGVLVIAHLLAAGHDGLHTGTPPAYPRTPFPLCAFSRAFPLRAPGLAAAHPRLCHLRFVPRVQLASESVQTYLRSNHRGITGIPPEMYTAFCRVDVSQKPKNEKCEKVVLWRCRAPFAHSLVDPCHFSPQRPTAWPTLPRWRQR